MKNVKFNQVIDEWLLHKRYEVKESTYTLYKYKSEKYLKTYFVGKKISYFKTFDLNLYKEYLKNTNLSDKTIKDILSLFISILKFSQKKYDENFKIELLTKPKTKKRAINILTDSEQKKLKEYCLNSNELRDKGILIALYSGLRIGEICGLKWKDIDLRNKVIYINRTVQRIYLGKNNTKIIIDTPKTESSLREVPMADIICDILKRIKRNYLPECFLLTGSVNKCIEPRNFQYCFIKDLRKCNIRKYNFHSLRHTFATNCIRVGMDVKSLSEVLGHSDVSITLNRYVHSSDRIKKKFINRL